MTLSLESHPSTPPGYNYPRAAREKKKKEKRKHPALKRNNSGDDGGEDLSGALFRQRVTLMHFERKIASKDKLLSRS